VRCNHRFPGAANLAADSTLPHSFFGAKRIPQRSGLALIGAVGYNK
jgi:hypothetical protein